MNRRSLALASVVVLAIVIAGAVVYYFFGPGHRHVQTASQSPIVGKAQVGRPAPEFEVATTAGLFDLNATDKPVFLEVFATWCPHCQHEVAVVDRLYKNFGDRVAFVGVSGSDTAMDGTSASSELDVLEWIKRFHVSYPIAYDPLLNVANLYLQGGFPTIAIVDRHKKVTYLNSGEVGYDELRGEIEKVLR